MVLALGRLLAARELARHDRGHVGRGAPGGRTVAPVREGVGEGGRVGRVGLVGLGVGVVGVAGIGLGVGIERWWGLEREGVQLGQLGLGCRLRGGVVDLLLLLLLAFYSNLVVVLLLLILIAVFLLPLRLLMRSQVGQVLPTKPQVSPPRTAPARREQD